MSRDRLSDKRASTPDGAKSPRSYLQRWIRFSRSSLSMTCTQFGGDEFCFLIPDLEHDDAAREIAERFRRAVESYDWSTEDARLAQRPVMVDHM